RMSTTVKPIPILVTGVAVAVGSRVIQAVKPEYEVVHFTLAPAATKEIPLLLKGQAPKDPSSDLGSGNWDVFPKALVFGGGYTDEMIEAVQKAVAAETEGVKRIPWLRVDSSIPHPTDPAEYAPFVTKRLKATLKKLEEEGKFDADHHEIRKF
ncbi:hypothetical protein R3P38DRAFT_2873468, partial [Favolaschia claudopus]